MGLRIKNCKITISYYCFALIALAFVLQIAEELLVCLFAALLHELGHMISILRFTRRLPRQIKLNPFGLNIETDLMLSYTPWQRVVISLSGPLVNLLVYILCLCFFRGGASTALYYFRVENLLLFGFNMLPIISLDGGNILLELLCRGKELHRAEALLCVVSLFTIMPIFFIGFYFAFNSSGNVFFLFMAFYLSLLLVARVK
jgi:stage IV sporulation protein FB